MYDLPSLLNFTFSPSRFPGFCGVSVVDSVSGASVVLSVEFVSNSLQIKRIYDNNYNCNIV